MKQVRSPRQAISRWHRNEEATIDHLVRTLGAPASTLGTIHSAFTPSGLPVEDQIRKAWQPATAGLAMF